MVKFTDEIINELVKCGFSKEHMMVDKYNFNTDEEGNTDSEADIIGLVVEKDGTDYSIKIINNGVVAELHIIKEVVEVDYTDLCLLCNEINKEYVGAQLVAYPLMVTYKSMTFLHKEYIEGDVCQITDSILSGVNLFKEVFDTKFTKLLKDKDN